MFLWALVLLFVVPVFGFSPNSSYDPLRGTYLDSFRSPSGVHNCSVYIADRTMFFISGASCNVTDPFVHYLEFYFSDEPVPRVIYTKFGVILEVASMDWNRDHLLLKITSRQYANFIKEIDFIDIMMNERPLEIPTIRGLGGFADRYLYSSSNTLVMNTKTIMIFYLTFENYHDCDAYFWVGYGEKPAREGRKIPDERGSLAPLQDYYKKSITLTLPKMKFYDPNAREMTIYDFNYLGVYCPKEDIVYGYLRNAEITNSKLDVKIHPPFIFDRFFLGEDILLCLPNNTWSREIGLNDSISELPCLGGSNQLAVNEFQIILLLPFAAIFSYQKYSVVYT